MENYRNRRNSKENRQNTEILRKHTKPHRINRNPNLPTINKATEDQNLLRQTHTSEKKMHTRHKLTGSSKDTSGNKERNYVDLQLIYSLHRNIYRCHVGFLAQSKYVLSFNSGVNEIQ